LDNTAATDSLLTHYITLDQTKLTGLRVSFPANAAKKCALGIEYHAFDNAYAATLHQWPCSTDVTSESSVCSYKLIWKQSWMRNSGNEQLYSLDMIKLRHLESNEAGLLWVLKLQPQVAICIAKSHAQAVVHVLVLTYHTNLAVVTKLKQSQNTWGSHKLNTSK